VIGETDRNRRNLISRIEDHLKKSTGVAYRVLSYVARFDVPAANILPQDAVMFQGALKELRYPKELMVVIHSPGGVIEATEKIGLLLRDHVDHLVFLVPDMAKSAATLLTLAGNEIYMSDLSELGPIDPQIVVGRDPNTGTPIFRPAWSIINAPSHLQNLWKTKNLDPSIMLAMVRSIDTTLLEVAQNALSLAEAIAKGWLSKYMALSSTDADRISKKMNDASQWLSHGRPIRLAQAQEDGLKAVRMDSDLEELSFELYFRSMQVLRERRVKIVDWSTGGLAADM